MGWLRARFQVGSTADLRRRHGARPPGLRRPDEFERTAIHGAGWFFMCLLFPIIAVIAFFIGLIFNRSKFEAQLSEIETRVLASHGFRTRRGLDIYEGEPRRMSRP